jgi:hypothetical protein
MQNQLQTNYNLAAGDINAADGTGSVAVSPVGEAWRALNYSASLYSPNPNDGVQYHPSTLGVLLNAMVNFDTIYHAQVSSIPLANVSGILSNLGLTASQWSSLAAVADATARAAANPTINSLSASATSVAAGSSFTITANVTDTTASINSVAFYRRNSDGTATFIGNGTPSGNNFTVAVSTNGIAAGSYTYFAVAADNRSVGTSNTNPPTVSVTVGTPTAPTGPVAPTPPPPVTTSLGAFSGDQDIGSPGVAGSASFNAANSTYTVSGGGSDIWNASDQFNFASESFSGDGAIVAHVTSITNTDVWAKAGVMFRASSAANSAYADVVATAGSGVSFQWRSSTGAQCGFTQITGINGPIWVKLNRTGNTFAGFYSTNGINWIQIGSAQMVTMPSAALVGLAVTAHNNSALNTATFGNVAVVSAALGAGWSDMDIGSPGDPGWATLNSGVYTVAGGGSDIWNAADQFNFASQSYSGNGSVVARVTSVTNTDVWAKAGVMFRSSTAANAAYADVVVTAGSGVSFQWRSSDGAQCGYTQITGITAPLWVKLTRSGNTFTGYYSTNGTNWIQIGGSQTVTMPTNALAGLAVTSHNNSALNTATFTNVLVSN